MQTLDTTGTLWPERQRFIKDVGLSAKKRDVESARSFGMNWKMTAKTILMQLHHKIQTFEHLNKRLVLAVQDRLLKYMEGEFSFGHLHNPARNGDSMQLHSYELLNDGARHTMNLAARKSTDAAGIATALGLQTSAKVELEVILATLQDKLSPTTRLQMAPR